MNRNTISKPARKWAYIVVAAMFAPAVLLGQTATTTSLTLSASQVAAGTPVQVTATVEAGAQPVSPGQVLFYDGKTLLGSAQLLSAGTAGMKLRLGLGAHSLTASFAGTKAYAKSSSGAQSLTVTGTLTTSTTLSPSGTNPYTLTATVTGSGLSQLTGSVNFSDQTSNLALGSAAPLGAATVTQSLQWQSTPGTGDQPQTVAVGDLNGDGIPDLAFINFHDNTMGVLLGNGDGTFQPQTTYAVGRYPSSVAVGDFNSDGKPDLVVTDEGDNTLSVLLGNGDGTFQSQATYATGDAPNSVAVGDFNGDGNPDVAVANSYESTVSVLLGNGNGTFLTQTKFGIGGSGLFVAVGDFNRDGVPDLVTANETGNTVSVLLGKGDGTFQTQTAYATGDFSVWVAVGDFNGDGILDLASTNRNSNSVSVLLGNGDGTFQNQTTYGAGNGPTSVVAADFNGDGNIDLAVANNDANSVSVLLGKGDGTFQAQTTYGAGSWVYSLAVGDLNGDGFPDLAIASHSSTVSVMLNSVTQTATGTLSNARVVGAGAHSLQASYPGNTTYTASSGTSSVQATPLATALTLSAPNTATSGGSVQLLASLSPYADGSLTTNSETVTFMDGTTVLGTAPLKNGMATLPATFSTPGPHVLQASYAGDTNFAPASSNTATVTVTQAAAFTITPTPSTETVKRGIVGGFVLALKSVNGFSGPVKLSCSGGPTGSSCLNLPQTVSLTANGTAYAVSGILFPRNSTPGTYTITFTGTSGSFTVAATAKFIVQ